MLHKCLYHNLRSYILPNTTTIVEYVESCKWNYFVYLSLRKPSRKIFVPIPSHRSTLFYIESQSFFALLFFHCLLHFYSSLSIVLLFSFYILVSAYYFSSSINLICYYKFIFNQTCDANNFNKLTV